MVPEGPPSSIVSTPQPSCRKLRSSGPKSVVANKGYKRYLKAEKGAFAVDLDKARDEERFDGM